MDAKNLKNEKSRSLQILDKITNPKAAQPKGPRGAKLQPEKKFVPRQKGSAPKRESPTTTEEKPNYSADRVHKI